MNWIESRIRHRSSRSRLSQRSTVKNHGIKSGVTTLLSFVVPGLVLGSGAIAPLLFAPLWAQPATAAEEIRLLVGGPLIFSVSVESLATYAETGEIADDLRLVTRFADPAALEGVRQGLLQEIPLNVQQVSNLGYSQLGEDILQNLGKVVRPHVAVNGDRGLRGAVITAAAEARANGTGWTPLDVLRQFPGETIDIRLKDLLALRRELTTYIDYHQAAIAAIQNQATEEAAVQAARLTEPAQWQDLAASGPYSVETRTLTLNRTANRQTHTGLQTSYDFEVKTFLPQVSQAQSQAQSQTQPSTQPAPVIIVSHGYSDDTANFSFLGRHLASHGFAVMIPTHVGSDLRFRLNYTDGLLRTAIDPSEFISRPEEISFLIDQLEAWTETSPNWAARIDPERIGMVGHSLGGATVQSLAGADFNFSRLTRLCDARQVMLNPSWYLQCQARSLATSPRLADPRIQAAISANGLSWGLFGPEGMGQIDIPLMMVASSQDILAPNVTEQIHPFFWVNSDDKYLALLSGGSHFSVTPGPDGTAAVSPLNQERTQALADLVIGRNRDIGSRYFEALNLAFWRVHLQGQTEYEPYLSARYAQQLSQDEPVQLDVVRSLQPEDILATFGSEPPIPFIPALSE